MWRSAVFMVLVVVATPCLAQTEVGDDTPQTRDGGRFFVFGGGIGSPSGVTAMAGYYVTPITIRFSGGYWEKSWNGVQGDLGVALSRGSFFTAGVSLVVGGFRANPVDEMGEKQQFSQRYVGLTYDMDLSGFFLQAGLGIGKGDYPNLQELFQFGYVYEIH